MRKIGSRAFAYISATVLIGGVLAWVVLLKADGIPKIPETILVMIGISLGTFVSEDLSCIGAGLLAASGKLGYTWAVLASFLGILIGDIIIFVAGYFIGRPLLQHRWARWFVSERAVTRAQHLFERHGMWVIIATRFLPGTRTATYFAGGAVHAPFMAFVGAFALAAALWTPFLVGISYFIGGQLIEFYEVYEAFTLPAILAVGLLLYLLFHYGIPLFTWQGRRRLKGKWIRATKWEFWPWWQVYWLVAGYILYLGIFRYRRPTLFTVVNPCMPLGGFLGESKGDILAGLAGAGDAVPLWGRISAGPCEKRFHDFKRLLGELGLSYPVVLKPDEGQRGMGVTVVQSDAQAIEWLGGTAFPAVLQEYVAGIEYGIFYVRKPSEETGRVVSITIKDQIILTGNGHDSLETLIHADSRAIVLLGIFLARFDDELDRIPDAGERIPLGHLGTHALGAIFKDGRHLITPELIARVDTIARSYTGFYFGRFDFKAPGEESLLKGEGLRIIELNGITSEATHIYDPELGLMNAWKTLCWQWRTAFEIAVENEERGHPRTRTGSFLREVLSAFRRQKRLN